MSNEQDILEILKGELEFIEKGGYGAVGKRGVQATATTEMFADSPICLNYGYPYRVHPCGGCPLMEFVPEGDRVSAMPCYHIPLDSAGHTLEEMEIIGNLAAMQEVVKVWLQNTIRRIESQRSA